MKVPSRVQCLCRRLPPARTILQHQLAGGGWGCSAVRDSARLLQGVNAYWVASATPESRQLLDKPDVNTYCPATGKKLRLKDLVPVKLTAVGHLSSRLVVCDYDHWSCAPMTILDSPCSTSLPLNPSSHQAGAVHQIRPSMAAGEGRQRRGPQGPLLRPRHWRRPDQRLAAGAAEADRWARSESLKPEPNRPWSKVLNQIA